MKIKYQILIAFMLAIVFNFIIAYGIDISVASEDYVKQLRSEDKTPITGCLFKYNCDRYNKLLRNK